MRMASECGYIYLRINLTDMDEMIMAELKELAEFYARAVAMRDPVFKFEGNIIAGSPCALSDMTKWTVEERQPDFQRLIDSGIDCEFRNQGDKWYFGKLVRLEEGKYTDGFGDKWKYCRPRLNHVHAWIATEDSKCPVPEGYKIKAYFAAPELKITTGYATKYEWTSFFAGSRIVAFEVLPK